MRSAMRHLLWTLFLGGIIAGVSGLVYWRATHKGVTATSMEEIERKRGFAVTVEKPVRRDFVRYLYCDGEVAAAEQYFLRARVGQVGAIAEKVNVDVGDQVSPGQVLVRFRLEDLKANVKARQTAYEEAQKNYERYKNLFQKGVVSADVLDARKTMLDRAASELRLAETQMQYARVVAPEIEGDERRGSLQVAKRFVDPGEFRRLGDPLLTLTNLAKVDVEIKVPSSAVARLKSGMLIGYRVAGTNEWQKGEIDRIEPASGSPNRFFNVYLRRDNRQEDGKWELRPGMYVEARIPEKHVKDALAVSASSVDWEGNQQYLYVIEQVEDPSEDKPDYVARRRKIEMGLRSKGYVQIPGEALEIEDRIVCNPRVDLNSGDRVWLQKTSCGDDAEGGK